MKPTFFATPEAFRAWLRKHHLNTRELLVGFHKKGTGSSSVTWPEAVDQALCFGWIDGVRKRVDDVSYCIRLTPRRPRITWSAVNIERVAELESRGLMQPAGKEAFGRRSEEKSRTYSYEQPRGATLEAQHQKKLTANRKAWAFFEAQAPWYQRTAIHWVVSAKKEETRLKRLNVLIDAFAKGRRP